MRYLRVTTLSLILAVAGTVVLDAGPAAAGPTLFGIRGGVTDDPDTVFLGGHLAMFPSNMSRLRIEPSFEVGFGEYANGVDLITLRGNANFKILFPVSHNAAFYPIIGLNAYYMAIDDYYCRIYDCDDTDFGLNLGIGFSFSGIGFDFSFELPDRPDFTFTLSYTFW